MPARFELTVRHWLNDSHVFRYVIVAILVSVQSQRREKGERGGREGERDRERKCERTIKRREGKEGKGTCARATEMSNLSLKSASAISKRDENIAREKQGRLYIYRKRKAMLEAGE